MKRSVLFAVTALTLSSSAFAADTLTDAASAAMSSVQDAATSVADAAKSMKDKMVPESPKTPVAQWTCEDFLALDESFRPNAVYFAEGFNQKDKPEDAMLDVAGVEQVIPMVVEACGKDPKTHFVKQVEQTQHAQHNKMP